MHTPPLISRWSYPSRHYVNAGFVRAGLFVFCSLALAVSAKGLLLGVAGFD